MAVPVLHTGKKTPGGAGTHTRGRFVCVISVPVCARVSRVCPGSPVFLSYAGTAIHTRILGRAVAFVMEDFTGVACAWLGTNPFEEVCTRDSWPGSPASGGWTAWVCFEETEGTCETLEKALKV